MPPRDLGGRRREIHGRVETLRHLRLLIRLDLDLVLVIAGKKLRCTIARRHLEKHGLDPEA